MAQVLAISLPMVISHACDTVMVFTDRLFLARLDPVLMNAAMGGGLTSFMLMSFFVGLIGFTTALVAQHLGAGRKHDCSLVLTQALVFSLCAYPLILCMKPLALVFFEFMGVGAEQTGPQTVYLGILLYASVIGLARMALSGFFSGIGRTRTVMAASCAAMVTNVALDYVFIFGKFGFPSMGIRGAAYATVLGGVVGLAILSGAYLRKRIRREYAVGASLRWDKRLAWKLWKFGMPTGMEMWLNIIAFNAMVMMFHSLGPAAATAATVVFSWDFVSFVPLIGIEIGVTSLVGRYMGARQPQTARRVALSGFKLGLIYSSLVLVFFAGFPHFLVEVFRPEGASPVFDAAVPTAVFMVRLASLYVLVEAMLCVFIGALRGAGDTLWAMRMSVVLHWALVFVLALVLRSLRLPPEAGWAVMVSFFLVFSGLVLRRWRQGKWEHIRVVEPAAPAEILPDIGEV